MSLKKDTRSSPPLRFINKAERRPLQTIVLTLLFVGGVWITIDHPKRWWIAAGFAIGLVSHLLPSGLHDKMLNVGAKYRRKRMFARRVRTQSKVVTSPEGIKLLDKGGAPLLPWTEIVEVGLRWEKNPWGDPQCGSYNDIYWDVNLSDGRKFSIYDSDVHTYVLTREFMKYLPGYAFTHNSWDKVATDSEGSEVCWTRHV